MAKRSVSSCHHGSPGVVGRGGQPEWRPESPGTGLPLARTGHGPGGHLEPTLPSETAFLVQRLSTCGPGSPVTEGLLHCSMIPGFHCGPDGTLEMCWGGYQVPSAQTHPRSGKEEGCDFGVFRGHSVSPEKTERGPGFWQCARPAPGNPRGCRSQEQNAQPSPVSEWSGTLGLPLPFRLHFQCIKI